MRETQKKYEPAKTLFEEDAEYQAFVDKFKHRHKMTTDDCYTPPAIYEAVLEWAKGLPGFKDGANVLRPFYPGGDYRAATYTDSDVVIDNPPFSILSSIVSFYCERGIPFFLFAPHLTLFSSSKNREGVTAIVCAGRITYENGAVVNTSFVTNMYDPDIRVLLAPDLHAEITAISSRSTNKRRRKARTHPDNVTSAALLEKVVRRGVSLSIPAADCAFVWSTDNGGSLHGGYLLSERATAEKTAAERAAAERAAAAVEDGEAATPYQLSEREKRVIASLGK